MSLRLRWKSSDFEEEAVFTLRGKGLALVCSKESGSLDRVGSLEEGATGIEVGNPGKEGRVELLAHGDIEFLSGEKTFRRVRIKTGAQVEFRSGKWSGELILEGKPLEDDPLVGKELGGYKVLSRLGAGGVGIVYRALQLNLDREVALKVLNPKAAESPVMVASFHREAQAAGRLSHPNLVQVHDVGKGNGLHFFSMEIVPGGNLEEKLDESGPMPWRDAVEAVRDCAMALAFAQEHELVHRDVKPENLMVGASGNLKLADLGLAATRGLVEKEVAGGTPHFMAPEAFGGRNIDGRADLYSLGCTLYRLLTGETVFKGPGVREILRAHREKDPPPLPAEIQAPAALVSLLSDLLEKNPENRPDQASDVVARCETLLAGKASRKSLAVVGVIALGAIGFAIWQAMQPEPEMGTETIVEYVQVGDEGATAEAILLRMELAWANTENLKNSTEKISALEAFLGSYPSSPHAEGARQALGVLVQARDSAKAEEEARVRKEATAWEELETRIDACLEQGHPCLALEALASFSLGKHPRGMELNRKIRLAGDAILSQGLALHKKALQDGDHDGSREALAFLREGLQASDVGSPSPWAEDIQRADEKGARFFVALKGAAFQTDRIHLIAALTGSISRGLEALDLNAGALEWTEACGELGHARLGVLASRESPFFKLAARGADSLRARLGAGEEFFTVEPSGGKRVRVLGIEGRGLAIMVQIRGERVRRIDPIVSWLRPESFSGLLRSVLSPSRPPEEACALHLLAGQFNLANQIRKWEETPGPEKFQAFASEARAWVDRMPRKMVNPPDWYQRHLEEFEKFALFGEAMARGEIYLGQLHLEQILDHFSLMGVWTSEGSSLWGLTP